jgi:hypothetical protein
LIGKCARLCRTRSLGNGSGPSGSSKQNAASVSSLWLSGLNQAAHGETAPGAGTRRTNRHPWRADRHEGEKFGRRDLVRFQHPTGVAQIAEQHGEPEAAVAAPLAGDQIEFVPAEGIVAYDLPLVGGANSLAYCSSVRSCRRAMVLSTWREKPAIAADPVSAKRRFPAGAKVSGTPRLRTADGKRDRGHRGADRRRARVSTQDQDIARQRDALTGAACSARAARREPAWLVWTFPGRSTEPDNRCTFVSSPRRGRGPFLLGQREEELAGGRPAVTPGSWAATPVAIGRFRINKFSSASYPKHPDGPRG